MISVCLTAVKMFIEEKLVIYEDLWKYPVNMVPNLAH